MSVAKKCDRCKTYHDHRIYGVTLTDPNPFNIDSTEYDLCLDCVDDFVKFMNGEKPSNLLDRPLGRSNRKD